MSIDTGEATVVQTSSGASGSRWIGVDDEHQVLIGDDGEIVAERAILPVEIRQRKNLERANKRARTEFRRYCVRNRLSKMWTLTFADAEWDRSQIKRLVNELFVRWREYLGGQKFPYAYVLELHPGGHGYHVHIAVPSGYMSKYHLQALWGLGIVHFKESARAAGLGSRERSRRLASYLAKYLDKSMDDDHELGEHRYEVAEGFAVQKVRRSFRTFAEAVWWLEHFDDESFVQVWCYRDSPEWEGPPVWLFKSG